MDFAVAYSAQNEGSNPGARRICLAQGQRGKKVADYTGFEPGTSWSESGRAYHSVTRAPRSRPYLEGIGKRKKVALYSGVL